MDTEVRRSICATDKTAQYDESAKRLLGQKSILAHIMVNTIDEFKGMNPKVAATYIEGEPYIGVVPVEPGLTNISSMQKGERIIGLNTESKEINEGSILFDIIFYVRMKDGLSQIIVNVETQKDNPSKYKILNRSIYYACRMISSQKDRDFRNSNYDDIKRVYSIWVCMNMKQNSMTHVHLTKEDLLNSYDWEGDIDLLNVILIGLAKELVPREMEQELHRLLGTLLSKTLTVNEKCDIIETEYGIPMSGGTKGGVGSMCNLGLGILEDGIAIGEIQGAVKTCKIFGIDRDRAKQALIEQFSTSEEQAEEYLNKYWQ